MPIAVIIDLVASKSIGKKVRVTLDEKGRSFLKTTYNRFKFSCLAKPTLTQGDSIELLVKDWWPIIFLFHRLLMENLIFTVGLGTTSTSLLKEFADECDGQAFWNARNALNKIKERKKQKIIANFILEKNTPREEVKSVTNSLLFLTVLRLLTKQQIMYCYFYLWENKTITEIATLFNTSKGNISRRLGDSLCFTIKKILLLQDTI